MMEKWASERAKSEEREGQTQAYCESLAFQVINGLAMIPACAPLLPRPTSHSCSQIKGLQEENEQLRQALAEAGYSLDASGTPTRLSAAAQRTALHENISVDGAGGHGVQLPTTKATRGGGGSVWQCVYVGDTHTNPVQGIASSTDGGVATASWDGTVRLFRDQKQGCAAWGQAWSTPPRTAKVSTAMICASQRKLARASTLLMLMPADRIVARKLVGQA